MGLVWCIWCGWFCVFNWRMCVGYCSDGIVRLVILIVCFLCGGCGFFWLLVCVGCLVVVGLCLLWCCCCIVCCCFGGCW